MQIMQRKELFLSHEKIRQVFSHAKIPLFINRNRFSHAHEHSSAYLKLEEKREKIIFHEKMALI